ncbi:MAG TPA: DUF4430 domain-containing protein [Solirubrobacteraceae bacterium]|nr:DUF4430 domain-containing protein [Solirubrobacteraceae bacterium]
MSRCRPALTIAVALAAAAAVAGGCGLGAGAAPHGVSLLVTRDFGAHTIGATAPGRAHGSETVMRFLERGHRVETRYGGGFVQSINGLAGGRERGAPVDWFFYVNGIEAPRGAAATVLHAGDRVWWDRHVWSAAMRVPAVVGSFPEPFRSGSDGKRLPVRIDCARGATAACAQVARHLDGIGVTASSAAFGGSAGKDTVRLLVGPWAEIRGDAAATPLERGPGASGVFARPARDGRSIALLNDRGAAVRALAPGGGLVAATRYRDQQPTWIVTGADRAGVEAAARALTPSALQRRFAIAVEGGRPGPLPLVAR